MGDWSEELQQTAQKHEPQPTFNIEEMEGKQRVKNDK
jgi:hypothetical protein